MVIAFSYIDTRCFKAINRVCCRVGTYAWYTVVNWSENEFFFFFEILKK